MAAAAPPVHTVRQAMVLCGVDDHDLYDGATKAERIAEEIFGDDHDSCMDITGLQLEDDFKSFADLRVNQGQIKLPVGTKKKIKAFIQWSRDELRMGRNPTTVAFPVGMFLALLARMATHNNYVKNAEVMAKAAEPKEFTNDMHWEDWAPTFVNYLAKMPGRFGVPLKYVIRDNDVADPTPHQNFLEEYVNMANLIGPAYVVDNENVLTLLVKYVTGHTIAEGALQTLNTDSDGRQAWKTLKHLFLGQGVLQTSVVKAENTIEKLFYGGEKWPQMWWAKFEMELTKAYATVNKASGRNIHDDQNKLRKLQQRIKCDWMQLTKEMINARLMDVPMTMTFEQAIRVYRNVVQTKFPNGAQRSNANRRGIAQVGTGQGGGRGHGGNHGRQRNRNDRRHNGHGGRGRNHPDQETIKLNNGQYIKYHPSYNFTSDEMRNMSNEQRDRLRSQRLAYRNRQGQGRGRPTNQDRDAQIAELQSTIASLRSEQQGTATQAQVPEQVNTQGTAQSQISQVSLGSSGSAFGGRNRQARNRGAEAPR